MSHLANLFKSNNWRRIFICQGTKKRNEALWEPGPSIFTISWNCCSIYKNKLWFSSCRSFFRTELRSSFIHLNNSVDWKRLVDSLTGEHRSEWYETLNPKHQIPCAKFDDGFLADSVVISKYLCKTNGSKLYPECAMKQAHIDEAIIDVTEPNFKFRYFSRYCLQHDTIPKDSLKQ